MELYKNETKIIWNKKTIFYFIIGIILSIIWFGYCLYVILLVDIQKGIFLLIMLSIAHFSAISFAECDEQQIICYIPTKESDSK
jgi:hypothetical protein